MMDIDRFRRDSGRETESQVSVSQTASQERSRIHLRHMDLSRLESSGPHHHCHASFCVLAAKVRCVEDVKQGR